jgi:hypothetical protein
MSWFLTVLSPCFDFTINISDSGEMCAMKEVTLFSDDPKSKESAKQLGQVQFSDCVWIYNSTLVKRSAHLLLPLFFPFIISFVFSGNITLEPLTTSKYRTILWLRNGMNGFLLLVFIYSCFLCFPIRLLSFPEVQEIIVPIRLLSFLYPSRFRPLS